MKIADFKFWIIFMKTLKNCEEVYFKTSSALEVGQTYSKKDLATLVNEPQTFNVREGVSSCNNSNSYLLFVDLEKEDKEKRFHFDDFFEEDFSIGFLKLPNT